MLIVVSMCNKDPETYTEFFTNQSLKTIRGHFKANKQIFLIIYITAECRINLFECNTQQFNPNISYFKLMQYGLIL